MGGKQCKSTECCTGTQHELGGDGPEKPSDPEREEVVQQLKLQDDVQAVQVKSLDPPPPPPTFCPPPDMVAKKEIQAEPERIPSYMLNRHQNYDAPATFDKFNGCWMKISSTGRGSVESRCEIDNGILKWQLNMTHSRKSVKTVRLNVQGSLLDADKYLEENITLNGSGELVRQPEIDCDPQIGRLINGKILWSTGDEWHRDVQRANVMKYVGFWSNAGSPVAEIDEDAVHFLSNGEVAIQAEAKVDHNGKLVMILGDEDDVFIGDIIDGKLEWSDGQQWAKYTPAD